MASAWGKAWGSAFGAAFGRVSASAPVAPQWPVYSGAGGAAQVYPGAARRARLPRPRRVREADLLLLHRL